jgi:hypothetical protein
MTVNSGTRATTAVACCHGIHNVGFAKSTFGAGETFSFRIGPTQRLLDPRASQQTSKHAGSATDWQTGAAGRLFGGWKKVSFPYA